MRVSFNMGRGLMLAVAGVLVLGVTAGVAWAATRPASEFALLTMLNGEPKSGTSVTTATGSDVTMTVTSGRPYVINCSTESVYLPGTSVTTSTGDTIYVGAPKYVLVGATTTKLAFRAKSSAGTCVGNELQ